MEELTNVGLTKEQCALFILFQGQFDNLGFMFKEDVFGIGTGNVTLSFTNGVLKTIKKETFHYNNPQGKNA